MRLRLRLGSSASSLFVVLLGASLPACGGAHGRIATQWATEIDCPVEEVRITQVTADAYQARGCGRFGTFHCTGGEGLYPPRCAHGADLAEDERLMLRRAMFDLRCAATDLRVRPLGGQAYGVECGNRRATYFCENRTCILNSR